MFFLEKTYENIFLCTMSEFAVLFEKVKTENYNLKRELRALKRAAIPQKSAFSIWSIKNYKEIAKESGLSGKVLLAELSSRWKASRGL